MKSTLDFASTYLSTLGNYKQTTKPIEQGTITAFGDGIARVAGLPNAQLGEIIRFSDGSEGLALNLNQDDIGCIILGEARELTVGDAAYTTGQLLSIPASDELLGRVITPLGLPEDGKPIPKPVKYMPIEKVAPGVVAREPVNQPLQTGVKAIDSMIPIGRGQRELIIGDRSTGKSAIALTTIINQKNQDIICIYVAIGQKRSFVAQTINTLQKYGAMDYTIIVSASASESATLQYLAPYAGSAIAEYFMEQGKDVLIVYDDLSKHAWAYREVSLLLRRPSGREAYPGDVFYLHSRLLERAVKLNKEHGGGSITALPIIETQAGDVSAYIPTNVISITDGQIFLDANMFNAGQRPAVDIGISVSRVGGSAQIKAMKQVVGSLKIDMAQYRELAAFSQFASDLDAKTKAQLERGQRITEILKQGWDEPVGVIDQVVVFWAIANGYVDSVKLSDIKSWEKAYIEEIHASKDKLIQEVAKEQKLSDSHIKQLHDFSVKFNQSHPEWQIEQ
jgi:F-type H+/Na+-transporting ATPase subunit alpha